MFVGTVPGRDWARVGRPVRRKPVLVRPKAGRRRSGGDRRTARSNPTASVRSNVAHRRRKAHRNIPGLVGEASAAGLPSIIRSPTATSANAGWIDGRAGHREGDVATRWRGVAMGTPPGLQRTIGNAWNPPWADPARGSSASRQSSRPTNHPSSVHSNRDPRRVRRGRGRKNHAVAIGCLLGEGCPGGPAGIYARQDLRAVLADNTLSGLRGESGIDSLGVAVRNPV